MKTRNVAYDLMKGIALILMMYDHLVKTPDGVHQFIYSFHMPLFFILAGVFAKNIEDIPSFKDFTRKNAKRLLLPYAVTMLMLCAWGGIQAIAKHDVGFFLKQFFSMITTTIDGYNSPWGFIYVGPLWFLVSLFWVREFFYGIQRVCMRVKKYKDELVVGICIVLSVLSVFIRPYLPALPFSFMPAFTAIAFYAVGWYIHNHPQPWWVYALSVLVWPFAILYGQVAIDECRLDYYPLSFLGACGGAYVVYLLCKVWSNVINKINIKLQTSNIVTPLTWCGVYSLPILCMHTFEMHSDMYYSVMCRIPVNCERAWGGVIAVLFAYILIKLPILKDVYK